jgi:hypothetical protein
LIDDVMLNDVFSAIPNQSEALRQRKAATGSNDAAWHGDVYKTVWMIKAFHNNLTVRTFWKQQPQSLVYYSRAIEAASGSSANALRNRKPDLQRHPVTPSGVQHRR